MPSLEELADKLRGDLVTAMGMSPTAMSRTFNSHILAFAEQVRAEALREAGTPAPINSTVAAWKIVREVAELPDRTSPDDQPSMMLVTAQELHDLIVSQLPAALDAVPPADVTRTLARLENANDAICAARTQQIYDLMLDSGQQDLLNELDDAR